MNKSPPVKVHTAISEEIEELNRSDPPQFTFTRAGARGDLTLLTNPPRALGSV